VTRRRERIRKQLLNDLKKTRGYCKLKEQIEFWGELDLEDTMDCRVNE